MCNTFKLKIQELKYILNTFLAFSLGDNKSWSYIPLVWITLKMDAYLRVFLIAMSASSLGEILLQVRIQQ